MVIFVSAPKPMNLPDYANLYSTFLGSNFFKFCIFWVLSVLLYFPHLWLKKFPPKIIGEQDNSSDNGGFGRRGKE